MIDTDFTGFGPEEYLLAKRTGRSVEEVAQAVAAGDMRSLFDSRDRVTPAGAEATLDGWKTLWQMRDREQTRARAAELKAAAAAKVDAQRRRQRQRRRWWD